MMTHLLERFPVGVFDITLFEATARLGGKILTQRFDTIPAIYEAGVAELYDYSNIGLDPLKTLVQELGLKAIPMHGYAVVLGDEKAALCVALCGIQPARNCFLVRSFQTKQEAKWTVPPKLWRTSRLDTAPESVMSPMRALAAL
jgi:Flavin containing amine oxidoreductase